MKRLGGAGGSADGDGSSPSTASLRQGPSGETAGGQAMRRERALLPIHHPELDAIFRRTVGKSARTICVTAANPGEGVTTFALALARRGAAGGLKSVIVDADVVNSDATLSRGLSRRFWSPIDLSPRGAVVRIDDWGLGLLPAPTGADPLVFRDPQLLRRMFNVALEDFDLVIVDASAVHDDSGYAIPADGIAASCEATVLVVSAGVTSEHVVRRAAARLAAADAHLCGAVLNDRFNPSLADELCRQVQRLAPLAPGLAARMNRWVRRNALLNMQIG
ncbi:MAG: hypothetical protein IPK66_12105 [Rhodospirillales bacterium]|nr:hypothetical protein [Rhodospirillales bacterium]